MITEYVISTLIKSRYNFFNIFTYVAPMINLSFNSSTRILETKVPFKGNLTQSGEKKSIQFNDSRIICLLWGFS